MNDPKKREQEQAYIIPADLAQELAGEILTADSIGPFQVSEAETHDIVDTYYDTPDNDLRMSTVTLRTRVQDGELFMTFKGKEQSDDFTQDHSEWEFPWPSKDFSPEMLVAAAGLSTVQKRHTKRATRFLTDANGNPVAELNIDNSFYTVSTGEARIYEVEIERQGDVKMKQILNVLETTFPFLSDLRWNHGKFVTGKALEFAFGVTLDENQTVNFSSFGYLDAMFKQLKVRQK